MTIHAHSASRPRRRSILFWVATGIIAAEFVVGGVMDVLRADPFFPILKRLGYPEYFSVVLGVWKLLGAAVVLVPRFPRLKEWVYAGMFFAMTGATVSHVAVSDPVVTTIAPVVFSGLVIVSWILRPPERCELQGPMEATSRKQTIAYWITTAVLATECIVGGVMGALRLQSFLWIMEHLGYPSYFMILLGVWYLLAGVALLAPELPRLKEWAYAGLIFVYTGAIASRLAVGNGVVTLLGPALFTGLALASWALRPSSRRAQSGGIRW
jgi:uncharacterized membrane protein YphA (DoxX/SURF4 family)